MFFNYYWWDIVAKKANILKGYIGKNLESRLREGITVDLEQCGFELCGSTYMQIFPVDPCSSNPCGSRVS